MEILTSSLLCDGSSDRALLPILRWLLEQHAVSIPLSDTKWADLGFLREKPRNLAEKIKSAIANYPCDILFVHRDAEALDFGERKLEIQNAIAEAGVRLPAICVVPVRMTEAWLLLDEDAIRSAAGNPNGRIPLDLPRPRAIEQVPDPKETLFRALRDASGETGRRLDRLRVEQRRHRVAELMDCVLLRQVSAFSELEREFAAIVAANKWN